MGLFGSILKVAAPIVGGIVGGPVGAAIGGAVSGVASGASSSKSIKNAAQAEYQAAQDAIAEQRRQYDLSRADYAPYLEAGTGALGGITSLLGIPTGSQTSAQATAAQQSALDALKASPLFQSLFNTGEEAILQNAAATGGIRGGNTQRSLADFGADTFAQVIQQQLSNLGGVAGLGSGATDAVSAFGQQSAANIGNLTQQGASAQAGGILGSAGAMNSGINSAIAALAPYLNQIKF